MDLQAYSLLVLFSVARRVMPNCPRPRTFSKVYRLFTSCGNSTRVVQDPHTGRQDDLLSNEQFKELSSLTSVCLLSTLSVSRSFAVAAGLFF